MIFENPDELAVVGHYGEGVANLLRFLDRAAQVHPAIAPLRDEESEFLSTETNKNPYFVLECGEIFAIGGAPLVEQNQRLLAELSNLEPQMARAMADIEARLWQETHPRGFFARLFGARPPLRKGDSNDLVYALGLGGWTNTLFYEPGRQV